MSKIIEFKKISHEKIQKQYELEGCDEDLLDLVAKLTNCDPSRNSAKKKEESKAKFLNKVAMHQGKKRELVELSDEELDSAAGGLLNPEEIIKDPLKE